jgi:ectoine hydroxylase-related dioxygenase (phytanoyl-CoA dioxygenase family)
MQLTNKELKIYREKGFFIKKKWIDEKQLNLLLSGFIKILIKFIPKQSVQLSNVEDWNDEYLTKILINFRKKDTSSFGVFYDSLQNSSILQSLFSHLKTMKVVSELFNVDLETLSSSGHMLRVDVPNDTKNTLNWHQDSAYYEQNQKGDNGLAVLLPLVDLNIENGALNILEGSHREKTHDHTLPKKNKHSSEKFTIPQEICNKYNNVNLIAEAGDAVFLQINLIHKSGFNISDKTRFTAGIRFHNTIANDFIPGRLIYELNKTAEKLIK